MEQNWRDVRKDTLEFFRQIFKHLEELDLFDLENDVHHICLYIIFQPQIQASLQRTISSWNLHRMRTEHYKTLISIYELSREKAIVRGHWSGDPGDDIATASHVDYGRESENEPMPPLDELQDDPVCPIRADYTSVDEERNDGVFLNDDDEIATGRRLLEGLDLIAEDQNWGINLYCEAVLLMESCLGLYDE
ncbi:hypothetical protein C8J56DRAFT_781303 [Mycena floridula]|nr:hypothetical protein C8J56DRAFT_781303 [Mycena floridula]